MIKVNLLREQTAQVPKKKISITPKVSGIGLILLAIFLVLAAGLGLWWYIVNRQIDTLTETRESLRAENLRLQALRKQIADYETMKKIREGRIQVIEKLKDNQTGPVDLMNHVIESIPPTASIRLLSLEQKGDRIQIIGLARRSDTIPDLMSSLGSGKTFKAVELELIQEEKDGSRFSLICISSNRAPVQ